MSPTANQLSGPLDNRDMYNSLLDLRMGIVMEIEMGIVMEIEMGIVIECGLEKL